MFPLRLRFVHCPFVKHVERTHTPPAGGLCATDGGHPPIGLPSLRVGRGMGGVHWGWSLAVQGAGEAGPISLILATFSDVGRGWDAERVQVTLRE